MRQKKATHTTVVRMCPYVNSVLSAGLIVNQSVKTFFLNNRYSAAGKKSFGDNNNARKGLRR